MFIFKTLIAYRNKDFVVSMDIYAAILRSSSFIKNSIASICSICKITLSFLLLGASSTSTFIEPVTGSVNTGVSLPNSSTKTTPSWYSRKDFIDFKPAVSLADYDIILVVKSGE